MQKNDLNITHANDNKRANSPRLISNGVKDKALKKKLPEFFKPLLWSYNFSKINIERDKEIIIVNTLNYGDLKHWRWLIGHYGRDAMREVIRKIPVTEFRPQVRPLISLVFGVAIFNYAPRGAGRKA